MHRRLARIIGHINHCIKNHSSLVYMQATKNLIASALIKLAESKPINKISVREIAANCGITTVTFYNHFHDKYDLMIWYHVQCSQQVIRKRRINGTHWHDVLTDSIKYHAANRDFLLNALKHSSGHTSFMQQILQANVKLIAAYVENKIGRGPIPDKLKNAVTFYGAGAVQLIFDWLIGSMPMSPEELVKILEDCVPAPLASYLR